MQNEWITLKIHFGALKIRTEWKCKRKLNRKETFLTPSIFARLEYSTICCCNYYTPAFIRLTSFFKSFCLLPYAHEATLKLLIHMSKLCTISCCLHPFNFLHFPLTLLSLTETLSSAIYLWCFPYCPSLWNGILTSATILYSVPTPQECLAETSFSQYQ